MRKVGGKARLGKKDTNTDVLIRDGKARQLKKRDRRTDRQRGEKQEEREKNRKNGRWVDEGGRVGNAFQISGAVQ